MKKVLNILLICSLLTATTVCAKEKRVEKVKKNNTIQIIKPEKQKVNKKQELKKHSAHDKVREKSAREAEGMYETKFPVINSQIEYSQMNGEV